MTRAEKVKRAQEFRAQGLLLREIGERLGVAKQTAHEYLTDPDLKKARARKASYAKPCPSCGEPMDGGRGRAYQPERCQSCRNWPVAAIIDAMWCWADEHGGLPPRMEDWRHATADHPSDSTVANRVGWNNALLLAGFGLRCDRRPETQEWIESELRAGRSAQSIADDIGTTAANIYMRLRTRGTTVRKVRAAA